MKNAISWFQIPVIDFDRAVKFYNTIFATELTLTEGLGNKVAMFPYERSPDTVGGALYKGPGFEPSDKGTLVLLNAGDDLAPVLERVEEAGGKITLPKTQISSEFGYIAHFIDTEGNKVALHSKGFAQNTISQADSKNRIEVILILDQENLPPNHQDLLQQERELVGKLRADGTIVHVFLKQDRTGAILIFKEADVEKVKAIMETFPLFKFKKSIGYQSLTENF